MRIAAALLLLPFFPVPPTFAMEQAESTQTATVNEKDPTIKCAVIGDRPLHINWRRNGLDIATSAGLQPRQFTVSIYIAVCCYWRTLDSTLTSSMDPSQIFVLRMAGDSRFFMDAF